jgi:Tol biopolymer transport system component
VDRLETRGAAVQVLNGAPPERSASFGFDVSRQGTLVYRKTGSGVMTVQWLESTGTNKPLRAEPGIYANARLSPDDQRLALTLRDGLREDVWVYDERRDTMTRLTIGGICSNPIWSPDGRYVVFTARGTGMSWARADAPGQPRLLTLSRNGQVPSSFSPVGTRLAYTEFNPVSRTSEIWTVPVEYTAGQLQAGTPELFLKTYFNAVAPAFSPDGRWMAYQSSESGRFEVSVQAFPPPASGQAVQWPISSRGGTSPVWSRSGRELLYRSGDQVMAVKYAEKGGLFVVEESRVWAAKLGGPAFDLALDGKRLAVLTPVDSLETQRAEHDVVFLLNFFDYLRRLVPSQ